MASHTTPRYNLNGNLVMMKSPQEPQKVKDPWTGTPAVTTRTQLLQNRKAETLPDPSFDLDNDGHVGNVDLFVSKRFDVDKDGKLNAIERANAEDALKNGFLNNFRIGLESIGSNSRLRTLQKRGVVVENDNYEKIKETYPMMRHTSLPVITSRTQLLNERKKMKNVAKPLDNIFRIETSMKKPDGYVENPKHTSIKDIKSEYNLSLRQKMGMTCREDIKPVQVLSTGYMKNPRYYSQKQMTDEKRKELLDNLHTKANYNYISREEHLLEREKYLISHNPIGSEGLTMHEIKEKQRLKTNDYNLKTFSNLSKGVHGRDLPTFYENKQEYWKEKAGYVLDPTQKSQTLVWLAKTKTAPIDKFRESDVTGKEVPISSHVINKKISREVTDKPNHVMPFGGYMPVEITESEYKISNVKYRMSTVVGYFLERAAEMGIDFHPTNEIIEKWDRTKTITAENTLAPNAELPNNAAVMIKNNVLRVTGAHNPLRTTGFINKPQPDTSKSN